MMLRRACPIAGLLVIAAAPPFARAAAPRVNPFACPGEVAALSKDLTTSELRDELRKRQDELDETAAPAPAQAESQDGATPAEWALRACVLAELMRRTGDARAPRMYEQAIQALPDEPGLEVWYADYLRGGRGPRAPLAEQAEEHYHRALEKLRQLAARGATAPFDASTEERAQRGLISLYQQDGLPLSPWRAFPFPRPPGHLPSVALSSMVRVSRDTNDFGAVDDVRRFTAEAAFASSAQRLNRPLDHEELRQLVRTPWRLGIYNGLRIRVAPLGTVSVSYNLLRAPNSQIVRFTEPNRFGDVRADELAFEFKRALDLYPLFDLLVDGGYRRMRRVGAVEWYPDLRETVNVYEVRPALSRFVGPDKLTVGSTIVVMDIPIVPGGLIEDRLRQRQIRALYVDYAIYRPLLLPQLPTLQLRRRLTRGWHWYGGYVWDDEAFGVRAVRRRDGYAGTSLKGLGDFDITVQASTFSTETTTARRAADGTVERGVDPAQSSQQVRAGLLLLYRIVDEDGTPGLPRAGLAALNLVFPVRHDFALTGADTFENSRLGAELWGKFISTGLRGTTFLISAGYDVQRFHHLQRTAQMGHVDLRMGWDAL